VGRSSAHALLVLAALAGCSFSADYAGVRFQCEIDRDCPDGVSCAADGLCGTAPDEGDAGGGEACVDGDMPQPFTGGPGGSTCDPWGSVSADGATTIEEDGALVIAPAANMAITFGGCLSHEGVDFAGGIFAEVSQALPADAPSAYTVLALYNAVEGGAPFAMSMNAHAGTLSAYLDDVNRKDAPYDPQAMRWWRIRPAGGDILFETAPDGRLWTLFVAAPSPAMAAAVVSVGAGTNEAEVSPGTARIEGVNACPDL
jgi:hypothetical protein